MVFKPKKLPTGDVVASDKKIQDKADIARLRKQIAEAEADLDSVDENVATAEEEQDLDEPEEEIDEEPIINKSTKPVKKDQEQQLKLTAEEVISAIEFNIARAGQLLQLLKEDVRIC
jgi:hypothetical protein